MVSMVNKIVDTLSKDFVFIVIEESGNVICHKLHVPLLANNK